MKLMRAFVPSVLFVGLFQIAGVRAQEADRLH